MTRRFAAGLLAVITFLAPCTSALSQAAPPSGPPVGAGAPARAMPGLPRPAWDLGSPGGVVRANPPTLRGFAAETGEPEADTDAAERDGYIVEAIEADHWGDPTRDVVAEHFVNPLGATVGRKPPLDFSYALIDLTGSGYKSLVLWPRIVQVKPRVPDFGGVLKVYVFDGTDWHLALDDAAMMLGIRPHFGPDGRATGAMDLALVEQSGYKPFAYDSATMTFDRTDGKVP